MAARHQAEAASAEIRSVLERMGDAYIAFDTEWRYTYVNWRAAQLAQKPASELIGRCVWDEFPEAVKTPFFSELHRAMREQTPVEFDNYFAPLGRWFENSVYPSPSGVGVYYRDITERVRTHRALEKRTADLARKNSELHMFAYVASHDLQEPLRMIGGYAALIAKRYSGALDREADEFIRFITGGVDRMQRLIKGLLALCRLEEAGETPYSDVDSGHILDIVCENLDLFIEDTGAIIERNELPVIKFEEMQLLQVMQNLVSNALKYRRETPRIVIGARRKGAAWTFSVSDNGIGFESQSAEKIFMPFKRLQRDDGGSGIGLAICKKIVESRGGRIWAESEPGKGSTFFFSIPDALPAAIRVRVPRQPYPEWKRHHSDHHPCDRIDGVVISAIHGRNRNQNCIGEVHRHEQAISPQQIGDRTSSGKRARYMSAWEDACVYPVIAHDRKIEAPQEGVNSWQILAREYGTRRLRWPERKLGIAQKQAK